MSDSVTIVVPHFRAEVLSECLESLFAHSELPIRVIVVDDGPDAPSIQEARRRFPQIEILRNDRNLGFCASCNRGLRAADSDYAVLLNDDTRVTAGWLAPLIDQLESDHSVGACQPKLLAATREGYFDYGGGSGGYIDRLGYTFCRGRVMEHLERDEGQYEARVSLFWACGSALCMRLDAGKKIGLLDEEYVAHFEEIDFCWRLQLAGYRIVAIPESIVYHHSGFSLPASSYRKTYLNHRNNLVMLCKNLPAGRLLGVLPVRFALEFVAPFGYLITGKWRSLLAPVTALLWMFTHPFTLYLRRRQSQSLRRKNGPATAGVYDGSILYQYYVRRIRQSGRMMPEGARP